MEGVAQIEDVEIEKIIVPTISVFAPLLEAKRKEIESVPKRTFQYGDTERHKLDIYYPTTTTKTTTKTPIVFFVYGGGFVTGARTLPPPADIAYANVLTWFSARGFVAVVPDYRLVPHVQFPGPAQDVADAVRWVVEHPQDASGPNALDLDLDSIFLIGQSAGAAHVATSLLYPNLIAPSVRPRIRGAVLIAGAYHLHPAGTTTGFEELVNMYWASEAEARATVPLALLNGLAAEDVKALPPLLLVEGEREPQWVKVVGKDFYEALKGRVGEDEGRVRKIWGKAHNHLSITWCLGTGEGEEWAEEAVEWMKAAVKG
ncbi:hypothetical protein HGRIS_010990 [Hohenbuehelia grisea]|uniref:BD-FAE-like domain-containing protein n=1 Tax=Hohenbuehelia grisea TaxID=104357 RepID=A0ABR3IYG2_9AGAR